MDSTSVSSAQATAIRKSHISTGTAIILASNFFAFKTYSEFLISKLDLKFEPELSPQLFRQRDRVVRKAANQIRGHIGPFVFANTALYYAKSFDLQEEGSIEVNSTFDNVDYVITLTPTGVVDSIQEQKHFYNKFFNSVQARMDLTMMNRKFYNPNRAVDLPQHSIKIWPGYVTSVSNYEGGCFVNIDVSHRMLRTISCKDQLAELKRSNQSNFQQAANKMFIGAIVMTSYNKKCYRVEEIEWSMNPQSSFSDSNGQTTTFSQYYQVRWQQQVTDSAQPMFVAKVKQMTCYLVPELCQLTGLTDEIRSNFNTMKDISNVTKKSPHERLMECSNLVKEMKSKPKTASLIQEWKVLMDHEPVQLTGRVLDCGSLIMNRGQDVVPVNKESGSFDREVQRTMYSQEALDIWGIFYVKNDQRLIDTFKTHLQAALKQFNVQCNAPAFFPVSSNNWGEWEREFTSKLNPNVKMIVCIVPGNRGKSPLYDDLKRKVISEYPIPSQVILNSTLKKDRGLRSVVNKVVVQINAKIGGIPWVMKDLPCSRDNTMIVGIDVFHKKNCFSVLGFCATVDSTFSKYVPICKAQRQGQEINEAFQEVTECAIQQYIQLNGRGPSKIIVFRDGVSDSQRSTVLTQEVGQMKQGFSSLMQKGAIQEMPELVFLIVNKRINARFFSMSNGSIGNPPIGTIVDNTVVEADGYDFYVLPAKATQGAMTPTHFHVIYDDSTVDSASIIELSYRLCFTYYNWSGSVRVPSPCQYAHKLAYQNGERAKPEPPVPHSRWETTTKLYFL